MDCREFRNKHVAFVDDLLPAREMDAMRRHVAVCPGCSRQDTRVRRSLILVRNLRPIEPSADFIRRLSERLDELGPVSRDDFVSPRFRASSLGAFAALAAGVAAVAYFAVETNNYFAQPDGLRFNPANAVATAAQYESPTPISNAALVAAVPTGIPVWPAVLMVGQAPVHFASMEFREVDQPR